MLTTLAFFPSPEDMDDDFFGVPILAWSDPEVIPPLPEPPSAPPAEVR